MGHDFIERSRAVTRPQPTEVLTAETTWELVVSTTKALHTVMRRHRRDRWWFLHGQRVKAYPEPRPGYCWAPEPPPFLDLRKEIMGQHVLFTGQAPGLACTLRADWINPGHPPTISVDFRQGRERAVTVRVGLYGERQRTPGPTLGKLAKTHAAASPELLKLLASLRPELAESLRSAGWSPARSLRAIRAVRAREPLRGDKLWWIDPDHTPADATRFVFLLYLWQVGVIDLTAGDEAWGFVKAFIQGPRYKDLEDGELYDILSRMRQHYALPQHWKALRVYIRHVIRDVRAKAGQRPDKIAARLSISRRTFYRWRRQVARSGSANLTAEEWAEIGQRAERRALRREAMRILTDSREKSPEVARKLIQRRLGRGGSLETIVRKLRKGGRP